MKKILGILIIICIAITCLGVASAAEATVGDTKFNVPDGYELASNYSQKVSAGIDIDTHIFLNKENKNITIDVSTLSGNVADIPPQFSDGVEKTVKDKNGTFSPSSHKFHYKDGNKVIEITYDQDKFEDIII